MQDYESEKVETIRIDLKKSTVTPILTPSEPKITLPPALGEQPPAVEGDRAGDELFTELFESCYDGVLITTPDGEILRSNERAQALFLLAGETLSRVNAVALFSGADEGMLEWIVDKLQGKSRVFIECYCNRQDEAVFPADVTVSRIHFGGDNQLCFFVRNVTVRKQTEEALKQAQEELLGAAHKSGMAEIATGVLHDVGNVLNSINVSCELMAGAARSSTLEALTRVNGLLAEHTSDLTEFLSDPDQARKILEVYREAENTLAEEKTQIAAETQHLQRQVDLLREVVTTQQDYARVGLFSQETSVQDVINDALALQKTRLDSYNVTVERDCDPTLVVTTQKTKLVYVLINLIQNAVDALKEDNSSNPDARTLRIETESADDMVVVRVIDNGVGIPDENLTDIFTHGFTTKPDGHGFGLHTCANFMNEIGGSITVSSDGLGEGSRFELRIPVVTAEPRGDEADE